MIEPAVLDAGSASASTMAELSPTVVVAALADRGAVILRGFDVDYDAFIALTDRFGDRFTCDPTKVRGSRWQTAAGRLGTVARVSARTFDRLPFASRLRGTDDEVRAAPFGGFGINPHNENTFIPDACPELVWFLCVNPSADGGRTVLCDGVKLLASLPDDVVAFLHDEPIRYEISLSSTQWKAAYEIESVNELRTILDARHDVDYEIGRLEELTFTFDTNQISATRLGNVPAAHTNVLSRAPYGRIGRDGPVERTTDGERVPSEVVQALLDGVVEHRAFVDLGVGDVLLIDNSRVMHGREPFEDTSRRILTRCGWLDPALAA